MPRVANWPSELGELMRSPAGVEILDKLSVVHEHHSLNLARNARSGSLEDMRYNIGVCDGIEQVRSMLHSLRKQQ